MSRWWPAGSDRRAQIPCVLRASATPRGHAGHCASVARSAAGWLAPVGVTTVTPLRGLGDVSAVFVPEGPRRARGPLSERRSGGANPRCCRRLRRPDASIGRLRRGGLARPPPPPRLRRFASPVSESTVASRRRHVRSMGRRPRHPSVAGRERTGRPVPVREWSVHARRTACGGSMHVLRRRPRRGWTQQNMCRQRRDHEDCLHAVVRTGPHG